MKDLLKMIEELAELHAILKAIEHERSKDA